MKKILLVLGIVITYSLSIFAQHLSLSNGAGAVLNGDTVTLSGDVTQTLFCYMNVTNNSGNSLSVKCIRTNVDVVSGSENTLCWGGECAETGTGYSYTSNDPTVITAGATVTEFSGDYKANGNEGISIIRYRFFDMNAVSDSICFYAKFNATAIGIKESLNTIEVSDAYPNPANSYTYIAYKSLNDNNSAKITVSNLLGQTVISIPVTDKTGKIKIETAHLDNGIYFYSFSVQDSEVYTKKLVVRH